VSLFSPFFIFFSVRFGDHCEGSPSNLDINSLSYVILEYFRSNHLLEE